jgi:hypothetical protein
MPFVRLPTLLVAVAISLTAPGTDAGQKRRAQTAPETFTSPAQARTGSSGAAAATILMQIDRYTTEADRKTMTDALATGGYPAFLEALKEAPAVGYVELGDLKVPVRWAREQPTPKGRTISLVTDTPMYFIGGGRTDAKPREGFHLAIMQLSVDEYGFGTGTMAAAARVKPDGAGGVVMEDYAEEPIKLTFVRRGI